MEQKFLHTVKKKQIKTHRGVDLMDPEVQKQRSGIRPKNVIIISLVTFILLMLAVAGQFTYAVLKYDRVYRGVHINGNDVSGMYKEEITSLLEKRYQDAADGLELTLKADDKSKVIRFKDINAGFEYDKAAEEAFSVGRSGNILNRFYEIFASVREGTKIKLSVSYDMEKAESLMQEFYDETLISVKEADVLIQDDRVMVRSGHHGRNIDKNKALKSIDNSIKSFKSAEIEVPVEITYPGKINADDLLPQINREARDAAIKVENNVVSIIPHVSGRNIDKKILESIIAGMEKNENAEKVIPVVCTEPATTTEVVSQLLFRDTLASMTTAFSTSDQNDKNRAENIKIAVSKINNKILAPGETFSFNEIVGPRTEAGGFKIAHTYVRGKIVDGIGGGICQVSSTLYNAVLLSDLEVLERRNHMFTVGYVPRGRDATVSYGDVDFRFKNSTNWPIRIEAGVTKGNKLYFKLIGTNEAPGKTIEIINTTLKTTEFNTVYIDDPNLPDGQTQVKQKGMTGYVVDTYKVVKQDGKVMSQTKLHTSVYKPLDQEILKGTKKTQAAAVPGQQASVPHTTGVDDADNPPAQ